MIRVPSSFRGFSGDGERREMEKSILCFHAAKTGHKASWEALWPVWGSIYRFFSRPVASLNSLMSSSRSLAWA